MVAKPPNALAALLTVSAELRARCAETRAKRRQLADQRDGRDLAILRQSRQRLVKSRELLRKPVIRPPASR